MNKLTTLVVVALALTTALTPLTFISQAQAQFFHHRSATTTTATGNATTPAPAPTPVREHHFPFAKAVNPFVFREREHLGTSALAIPRAHFTGGHEHLAQFGNWHNFWLRTHQHFRWINNAFIVVGAQCPIGTIDNGLGECIIAATATPVIVQQPSVTVVPAQPAPTQTVIQQNTVAPIITCPAGSTLQSDNTCLATTTSTTTIQPLISCPTGSALVGNQCVVQQQTIVVAPLPCPSCPTGSTMDNNGNCVVKALPSDITPGSVAGQIIIGGNTFTRAP